jgi:hypothetical protein
MYQNLIISIDKDKNKFSRELILVTELNENISAKIGDNTVYISEFIVSKIMGYIPFLEGHPEVTVNFFLQLPELLNNPSQILEERNKPNKKYLICGEPTHRVVLEVRRNNDKTEINTIHRIRESTLRKLESKCRIL